MKIRKSKAKDTRSNITKSYISALSEFLLKLGDIDQCSITIHGARIGDVEKYSCKIEIGNKHPKRNTEE